MTIITSFGTAKGGRRRAVQNIETAFDSGTSEGLVVLTEPDDQNVDEVTSWFVRWLWDNERPYNVLLSSTIDPARSPYYTNIIEGAGMAQSAKNPVRVAATRADVLLLAWDDEDPRCMDTFTVASKRSGVQVRDIALEDAPSILSEDPETVRATPEGDATAMPISVTISEEEREVIVRYVVDRLVRALSNT